MKNILLIVSDQMRGDCMGIVGHPNVKTPYLDALAVNGIVYNNAYAPCPSCVPARAEMYTGMGQRNNKRVGYEDGVPWKYEHTIAGEFTKNGYYSQCVGKMHVHPLRSLQGFCNIDLHDGYLEYYRKESVAGCERQIIADDYFYWLQQQKGIGTDVTDTGLGGNSCLARPWIYEEYLHPTNWVATRSLDFLRRRDRDKPFFLMTSFVRPHAPLDAPQCYFDMYKNEDIVPPVKGDWDEEITSGDDRVHTSIKAPRDKELVRQQRIGYYACITHMDHQIGRIIQELDVQGILENTIVIFTADHGDQLGDHGLNRKAYPYRGSIHIPMIISGNDLKEKNIKSDKLVALRDVMPTALTLAGIKDIPKSVDGFSMLDKNKEREYLHGEHAYGQWSHHYIVTKTDKYIWYSQTGKEQYFDLENDKNETKNLINCKEKRDKISILRKYLINELNGREEGYTDGENLIIGRSVKTVLN